MNPNWLILILPGCQVLGTLFVYLFQKYWGDYSSQKGKNLADKEDKAELTRIEEFVRSGFTSQNEGLKTSFQKEIETLKNSFTRETEGLKAEL